MITLCHYYTALVSLAHHRSGGDSHNKITPRETSVALGEEDLLVVFKKERTTKTPYGFGTTLNVPYEEAIPRVKEALKAEGFGVLTEIDVRQTLREKLGAEIDPYLIETYAELISLYSPARVSHCSSTHCPACASFPSG